MRMCGAYSYIHIAVNIHKHIYVNPSFKVIPCWFFDFTRGMLSSMFQHRKLRISIRQLVTEN